MLIVFIDVIHFSRAFDLPPKSVDGECSDFIAVFSGTVPTKDKLIGKYCGSGTPSSLLVKNKAVYIQFVSNEDQVTGSGFVINFSTSSSSSCKFSSVKSNLHIRAQYSNFGLI